MMAIDSDPDFAAPAGDQRATSPRRRADRRYLLRVLRQVSGHEKLDRKEVEALIAEAHRLMTISDLEDGDFIDFFERRLARRRQV